MEYQGSTNKLLNYLYQYGLYIVFIILVAFFSTMSPQFLTLNNMINVLQQSAAMGIAAVGIVFVMLTAGIDISVGSIMFFSGTLSGLLLSKGGGILPAVLVALASGALVGAINGFAISKFQLVPFIATLATMGIGRGVGLTLNKANSVYLGNSASVIAGTRLLGIPVSVYVFILIMVIAQLILKSTPFGRQIYAIGYDKISAERVGINVKRNIFLVYFICGALAGVGGIISAAQIAAVTPNFATGNEFVIISAAILGGTSLFGGKGNVLPGAFIGILTITVIVNGLTIISASPFVYTIVRGIIIFIAVLVDSLKNSGDIR